MTTAKPGESSAPVKGTATVVIGCKLPHGLVLEVGMEEVKDANGSVRLVRGPRYASFVLRGRNSARIAGGYGITNGVPKDLAEEWFKRNQTLRYVKDGSVFIVPDVSAAKSEAKDRRALRTGLEPINPIDPKDPRVGREVSPAEKAAYLKQVAENPQRGAQIDELEG